MGFGHTWGDQNVYYQKPNQQRVYSMPASWTDLGPVDAQVALSSGLSYGRPEDLKPKPQAVRDPAFISGNPFFDSCDLVQVKYEMLRRVREEGRVA